MKKPIDEPIAIVGMACRFPGAPTLDAYWTLLRDGVDAVSEVPADRWDAGAVYDPDPKAQGKTNATRGGFIADIDQFDAAFFGITPREAAQMDPQQRILLELAHDALEDAGIAPGALAGSDTAVFVGAMTNDYFRQQLGDGYRRIDVHTGSGAGLCMLANRLSYQFDLRGPSVTVDTACSSSLVAVYQACQALWSGQSRAALAAGVNVMLDPGINVFYAKAGLSSPDARCKTFSAAADGIGRGEGAAVVVLKRLKDAIADGDPIYAMVRGGAVNHDGRSNGLTQPNRWAQEQLLRDAFGHARVDPRDVQYIELHGTGTLIGDPIEANALGAVLAGKGARGEPCLVGSVKSNFGHLEAAAGIAGLVKLALGIAHGEVPPSLWFDAPNPHIDFDALPLRVNTRLSPWLASGGKRLGGVSSFGLGGANAHLVLQSAPVQPLPVRRGRAPDGPGLQCLLLSARSEAALHASAQAMQQWLTANPDASVPALSAASIRRKAIHPYRLAVLGADVDGLHAGLQSAVMSRVHPDVRQARFRPSEHPLVLAVPDLDLVDGALLAGIASLPVARQAWMACRNVLARHGVTLPTADALAREVRVSINASGFRAWQFGVQYALARQVLVGAPDLQCVVADGVGQLAVLCALGALELQDVPACLDLEAFDLPADFTYPVACDFSSGPNPRRIQLRRAGAGAGWAARLDGSSLRGADVVVLGPSTGPAVDTAQVHCVATRSEGWARTFAELAMRHRLAWDAWAPDQPFVRLPSYPWQRQVHWLPALEPAARTDTPAVAPAQQPVARSPALLGDRVDLPTPAWQRRLDPAELPYLADHAVQDVVILPGAAYVELGLAVHAEMHAALPARLADLQFHSALVIDAAAPPRLHVALDTANNSFSIHSSKDGHWELHARGRLDPTDEAQPPAESLEALKAQCLRQMTGGDHYSDMDARGFGYGPAFRGVEDVWLSTDGDRALARIVRPTVLSPDASQDLMHPALFDAALQSMLATLTARGNRELYIPTGIDQLTLHRRLPSTFWCHGGLRQVASNRIEGDIVLFDEQGAVLATARGVRAQALTRKERQRVPDAEDFYRWEWERAPAPTPAVDAGVWLVVGQAPGTAQLRDALVQEGATAAIMVEVGPDADADFGRAVSEVGVERIAGVVCAATDTGDEPASGASIQPLVAITRTLGRLVPTARWVVVTRGLLVLPEANPAAGGLAQAARLGLARVATNEFPALRVRLVDAATDVDVHTLAREVLADSTENEVVLRQGTRSVPRLRRLAADALAEEVAVPIHADGSYLITGGYGGFGLELADWLARHGATQLVLVGRRGATTTEAVARIQSLRDAGVEVLELRADIADDVQVHLVLQQVRETLKPLKGVFHAAAVLDDAPLEQLTAAQIDRAAGAKARGAWHLHRLTAEDRLDHFVLFSSIASLLGGAGQGSYAMACAYLDALARVRQSQGLAGLSINWGALAQVGMATRYTDVDRYLEHTGVGMFAPDEALQRFALALRWPGPELGVSRMDWGRWAQAYPAWAASPRYAQLAAAAAPSPAGPRPGKRQALLDLPEAQRNAQILGALSAVLAQVMETDEDAIDRSVPLPSLGLDSLMAMDVIVAIEDQFGLKVPMLALMKGNNLTELAALVGEGLSSAAPDARAHGEEPRRAEVPRSLDDLHDLESAERLIARLGDLADEEVERLLQQITEEDATR